MPFRNTRDNIRARPSPCTCALASCRCCQNRAAKPPPTPPGTSRVTLRPWYPERDASCRETNGHPSHTPLGVGSEHRPSSSWSLSLSPHESSTPSERLRTTPIGSRRLLFERPLPLYNATTNAHRARRNAFVMDPIGGAHNKGPIRETRERRGSEPLNPGQAA